MVQATLLDDPALARLDPLDHHFDVFALIAFGLQLLECLRRVELRGQQNLEGVVDLVNALFRKSLAPETNRIFTVSRHLAGRNRSRERQNILGDDRAATDVGILTYARELMHRAQRSDDGVILDDHMAGERRIVCHDHLITDEAIVSHVGVRHQQTVTANLREAAALDRTPMNSHALSKVIAVADLQPGRLSLVAEVLRT